MFTRNHIFNLILLLIFSGSLLSCQGTPAVKTATHTATFSPTKAPTVTPAPTSTQTSTPAPISTATQTPSPTPTPPEINWNAIETELTIEKTTQIRKEGGWWPGWGREWIKLTMDAAVTAGIAPELSYTKVEADNIVITLPKAKITNIKQKIEFTARRYKISSNLEGLKKTAIEEATNTIRTEAIENDRMLERVEETVARQLKIFYKNFGVDTVQVVFKEAKEPVVLSIEEEKKQKIIVASEEISLDNCEGSGTVRISKELSQEFEESVLDITDTSGKIGGAAKVFALEFDFLRVELEKMYGVVHGNKQTKKVTINLEAKAGTHVVYTVVWKKIQNYGVAQFLKDEEKESKNYLVEQDLSVEIENSRNIGCE